MLSQLSGVTLMNTQDNDFELFEDTINESWDYNLRGQENFRDYVHDIWSKDGLILGLKLGQDIAGFIAFYYDYTKRIWLTEYFAIEAKRGIGFSKIILPSISYAFENMGLNLGVAVRGGNKRAQKAIADALGAHFVETGDETLFIVDLVPWTWGLRHYLADGLIVAVESLVHNYRVN
jgi:hypothetical protein